MKRYPALTLALLAAVHGPAAAFGPAGLPPNLSALRLQGVRVAAADVPGVPAGTAVGAQSSWQDLVRFSDQPNPLPYAQGIRAKAWLPAERQLILGHLDWVVRNQPGLWRRATAYGPLTLYRTDAMGKSLILTLYTTVTFSDKSLSDGPSNPSLTYSVRHNIIHELTHVADVENALSSKPAWRAAVETSLRDYHAQAAGLPDAAARTALADRLGLASPYGGKNMLECLAEVTAVVAMESLLPPNHLAAVNVSGARLAFVRQEVLSAPTAGPDLGAALLEGALHNLANRPADAYAAYSRALQVDPAALTAYIRRAEASLKDRSLPATAAADVSAARALLPDHHNYAVVFYEVATEAGVLASRHGEVLQDCAAAAAKGVENGAILFNCGRSRMMDSLYRGMRRQITPRDRDAGYAAALAELRRAKALAPHLAPKIAPVEKQLEGLLTPKPAA
jgi:hypothetical protein